LPPTDFFIWRLDFGGQIHHQLRFSTTFANLGEGPLELHGSPHVPPDGLFDATQRVYESPGGFRDMPVGTFAYHPEHSHFHFDDFARYELWTKKGFDRALAKNFRKGTPLAVSDKVSFCLYDHTRVDQGITVSPVPIYRTCTPLLEGISVGWADEYSFDLDGQGFDFGSTPPPDGDYVIRNVGDPSNRLWESEGKADPSRESALANDGYTELTILNGAIVRSP